MQPCLTSQRTGAVGADPVPVLVVLVELVTAVGLESVPSQASGKS
jgi:hypothetical protein